MNQDRIKDRILRRAARIWGYNELEAESSFDPVVSLLLSACAAELEKLDFELESSRSRILERILEVMFPEEVSGVFPARTILQVDPLENNAKISLYSSFKTTIRKQNIYNPTEVITKEVYFSPSVDVKLTTANVKYIAYGNTLNQVESFFSENSIGVATKNIPSGELWLGIQSPNNDSVCDLQFFVDINNSYQKELFFYYLQQVKVFHGEEEYSLVKGFNNDGIDLDFQNIITENYSDLQSIYNEINQFYNDHFYTLKGQINASLDEGKELLTNHFSNHKISEEDDVIWLNFKFSEAVVPDVLQNVRFALNCVPMLNIRNHTIGRKIKERFNIIPILDEDHFLDLDYVTDDQNGRRLDVKNYNPELEGMSAMLRKGGVSRFDKRNASELLQYLLELIKDETAAFAGMGINSVNETLRRISQNVASLHQVAKEKNFIHHSNPYLIISSGTDNPTDSKCTISYWSTIAEEANHLKPATVLVEEKAGNGTLGPKAVMITASVGGRNKLSVQDKILEYRSALLTRGRIVTVADIIAFGKNHFKNTITNIEVKKGTKKEVSLKGGFSRTIDIYLVRNRGNQLSVEESEWKYLCDSFSLKLKNSSSNTYPYRLFEV